MTEYRCISLDCPWPERGGGKIKRGADRHYALMTWQESLATILRSDVYRPAPSCHLWCWTTDNYLHRRDVGLGHASMATTARYVIPSVETSRSASDKASDAIMAKAVRQ